MPRGKSRKKWVERNREQAGQDAIVLTPEQYSRVEQWLVDGMKPGDFAEESSPTAVDEDLDEAEWTNAATLKLGTELTLKERDELLWAARSLAKKQPNIKQALRLYSSYVVGRSFKIELAPRDQKKILTEEERKVCLAFNDAITAFLRFNRKWWNPIAFAHRYWRDGDQFTHKVDDNWPPKCVFIDPEEIADPSPDGDGNTLGIQTAEGDITQVLSYQRIDPLTRKLRAEIPADRIVHTKIDVDSTEKRGISRFYPAIWFAQKIGPWLANELTHRKMQASIVLQRKVKGGQARTTRVLDNVSTGTATVGGLSRRQEKIRTGSIITTNDAVELAFCHPDTNFADSSPLGRWLLMQIAAATGWPYYAISQDSSEANLASQLVQESPVVLMVESEQDFCAEELRPVFEWVVGTACKAGKIPGFKTLESLMEEFDLAFRFPNLVTRDALKHGQYVNLGLMNKSFSPQEGSRQLGVDPEKMQAEWDEWTEHQIETGMAPVGGGGPGSMASMNQNPDQQAKNKSAGTGTNQGDGGPIQHDDKVT